jgi:lysophospholipase
MLEELGKTVILTGSQVPLSEIRNDAVENLLGALTIAGHFVIPEVALYFSNRLYRGNRVTKIDAVDFAAFDSPNLPPLVTVATNIDVRWRDVWRPKALARFRAHKTLDANVATLRLFPGITASTIRAFLQPPIRGVVLETYGAGNAPSSRADLLQLLQEASQRGVVVVNCTQCKRGLVSDVYETGRALGLVGVVPGADMTPECALAKLAYLLGKDLSPDAIRRTIRLSLRGELSKPPTATQFALDKRDVGVILQLALGGNAVPGPNSPKGDLAWNSAIGSDGEGDDNVQDRTERALAPVLLCMSCASGALPAAQAVVEAFGEELLNVADYTGRLPLHHACASGHTHIVTWLLGAGATVHARDSSGHSPLWYAASGRHLPVVELLMRTGAHWAKASPEAALAVDAARSACTRGDVEGLKAWLTAGISVDEVPEDHRSFLHVVRALHIIHPTPMVC